MPLVKITIRSGKSTDYKKALLDGVHNALVQTFRIPEHDRFQMFYELDMDHFESPANRTDNITIIELTVFNGRSYKAKKDLYKTIVDNLATTPGIDGNDIMIILNEPPLENWGIRGGKPASEVDLGFNIHT